jgi:Xaa-Pro aminopeptidase
LRSAGDGFVKLSFPSISGFNANGSIIHYKATSDSCVKIAKNGVYLIDSGAHYDCGTTDITRTIAIGEVNADIKRNFTLVLKGFIAIFMQQFKIGISGNAVDMLARQFLWNEGKDFAHGTGHGVGHGICVHEGPCSISTRGYSKIVPNMVLSNEPGFYKDGEYGIRIENLMYAKQINGNYMQFQSLTLCPIDTKMIDATLLSQHEKNWLNSYHTEIYEKISPLLTGDAVTWLRMATANIT